MYGGWCSEGALSLKNISYFWRVLHSANKFFKGEAFWHVWVSDTAKGTLLLSEKHVCGKTNVKYVLLVEELFSLRVVGEQESAMFQQQERDPPFSMRNSLVQNKMSKPCLLAWGKQHFSMYMWHDVIQLSTLSQWQDYSREKPLNRQVFTRNESALAFPLRTRFQSLSKAWGESWGNRRPFCSEIWVCRELHSQWILASRR